MNPAFDTQALVSVIIPVFNDVAGIVRCLRGIAGQSYPLARIEVIAVDNGSEPPLALEEQFPFETHVVRHVEPGSYAARNAGAAVAKGDVLAFIDADCWPDEDWLLHGVGALVGDGDNSIVGGEVAFATPENPTPVGRYQLATGFGQEGNIRDRGFSVTANLFCMRLQFERVGPFDTRLLSGGDSEWCWRAGKRGMRIHYVPGAVVNTFPRNGLGGAIRQARRVTAGRIALRRLGLAHVGDQAMRKSRSPGQSVLWILTRREFGPAERVGILVAATLIRAGAALEGLRIRLGGVAERR